jgi:hypothetical protein
VAGPRLTLSQLQLQQLLRQMLQQQQILNWSGGARRKKLPTETT